MLCVLSPSPQPFPSDTLSELQSMRLPFLEAVNTVIKTKLRASAPPPDCLASAATCLHLPHSSCPSSLSRESLRRRIPLHELQSCNLLSQARWQAYCRGENEEWWRGGRGASSFSSLALCLSLSVPQSLSSSLAHYLSVSLPPWSVCRARPALFCSVGLWTLLHVRERGESHCSGGWGVNTHTYTENPFCAAPGNPLWTVDCPLDWIVSCCHSNEKTCFSLFAHTEK